MTNSSVTQVTKGSHDKLKELLGLGGLVTWKMYTGLADTPAYYGQGIVSDLNLDAASGDELATFGGTISGNNVITTTDPN